MKLPEYQAMERQGVAIAVVPGFSGDREVLIHGRCYWEVTTYADGPISMQRMDTFYVNRSDKVVMADDVADGERMTIRAWHAEQARFTRQEQAAKP